MATLECFGTKKCRGIQQHIELYNVIPTRTGINEELVLYLPECKICGKPSLEIRRVDIWGEIIKPVRINIKNVEKFRENMIVLWEPNSLNEGKNSKGGFYLYCVEYGHRTKCFSNLSTLKMGKIEQDEAPDQRLIYNHIAA